MWHCVGPNTYCLPQSTVPYYKMPYVTKWELIRTSQSQPILQNALQHSMGTYSYQPITAHITKYLASLNGSLFVSANHSPYYKIPCVTQWELVRISQSQPISQNTLRHSMGAYSYQPITAHITKYLTSLNGSLFVSANHSPYYKIPYVTQWELIRISLSQPILQNTLRHSMGAYSYQPITAQITK